jgi:hypothetical protein
LSARYPEFLGGQDLPESQAGQRTLR